MREATEDTVLPVYSHTDDIPVKQIAVSAGTRVAVDMVGLRTSFGYLPSYGRSLNVVQTTTPDISLNRKRTSLHAGMVPPKRA